MGPSFILQDQEYAIVTIHTLVRLAHKLRVEPRDLWDVAAPEPKKTKRGRGRPRTP
jgi:hypothetical protein